MDVQHLIAEEELGERVRAFLQTDVGKYLAGVVQQDIEEAKTKLLELDPYTFKSLQDLQSEIAGLQTKARIAEKLAGYLSEAVIKGDQATHQLAQGDD